MFFKKTVLKRMLKSAYTGAGLTVGHTPEMIVVILWQEEELRTGKQKRSSGSTLKAQR